MKKRECSLSYCSFDYKHRHYWSSTGVDGVYHYYQCSQCNKWRREKIIYVNGGK